MYPKIYKRLATVKNNDLLKKMILSQRDCNMNQNKTAAMQGAAKVGDIEMIKWILENKCNPCGSVVAYAVKGNQLETLKWLSKRSFSMATASHCVGGGEDPEILKFLIDSGCKLEAKYAAMKGNIEVIKIMHAADPSSIRGICNVAVEYGHIGVLQFGLKHCDEINMDMYEGNVNALKWLYDNGYLQPQLQVSELIASTGDLECFANILPTWISCFGQTCVYARSVFKQHRNDNMARQFGLSI